MSCEGCYKDRYCVSCSRGCPDSTLAHHIVELQDLGYSVSIEFRLVVCTNLCKLGPVKLSTIKSMVSLLSATVVKCLVGYLVRRVIGKYFVICSMPDRMQPV